VLADDLFCEGESCLVGVGLYFLLWASLHSRHFSGARLNHNSSPSFSRHIGEEAQSSEGSETKAGRLEYLVKGTILNESCTRVMIKSSEIKSDLDNSNKITDEKKA
jgi:hypothetical protein